MCFQSLEVELGNCSMTEDPIPDLRGAMAVGRWTPRTEGRWNVISSFDFRVWVRLMPEFSLNSSNLSRWKYQQWQHWMASMLRWEQPQCDSWSLMDSIVYLLIRSLCFQSKDLIDSTSCLGAAISCQEVLLNDVALQDPDVDDAYVPWKGWQLKTKQW